MDNENKFSYWKKPWMKWLTLVVGLMQFPMVFEKMREMRIVGTTQIFTAEKLSEYMVRMKFGCITTFVVGIGFIGIFLIGTFAKSERQARIAEALLLIAIAVILSIGATVFGTDIVWTVILCLVWAVSIYTLVKALKIS